MAQPLLRILKQKHDCAIDVVGPEWSQDLVSRISEVRQGYKLKAQHGQLALKLRWQLGQILAANNYAAAYVLPNSLKSVLVPAFAGIPKRIGWRGEWRFYWLNDIRLLNAKRYPLMRQRYAALAYPYDFELDSIEIPRPELSYKPDQGWQLLNSLNLNGARRVLAIAPGAAFGAAKRWPVAYFAEVVSWAIGNDWGVVCLGSGQESELAQTIKNILGASERSSFVDLCGQTSLAQVIDLLSVVDKLVSNDSGLMHIACAVGLAPVVIYGPTDAGHTPPAHPEAQILENKNLDCRPCHKRECPLQHHDCMRKLPPDMVIDLLRVSSGTVGASPTA